MSIEGVDVPTMQRAINTYLRFAWGENADEHQSQIDFSACSCPEDVLSGFIQDTRSGRMRRFTLRLGNERYPFMKVVFQELLIRNRFFFSVDTHDELTLERNVKDYDAWLKVKRFNAQLKNQVEEAWFAEDVPTFATIVAQVEKETPKAPGLEDKTDAPSILIVDDEVSIARGVDTILTRNGYRTRQVHTAEAALEALKEETPDLILSDLEMPGMSGLELAGLLLKDETLGSIPFILATAAIVSPSHFDVINGFLVKPYDADVLLKFVAQHLNKEGPTLPEDTSDDDGDREEEGGPAR